MRHPPVLRHPGVLFFGQAPLLFKRASRHPSVSKVVSFFSLCMDIFKKYFEVFCDVILHICNLSLRTSIFPQNLKTSTVICIHKGGDRRTMGNYRPISLLPAFSKIIEKIVSIQLNDYFMCSHLFTNDQYGFLKKSSTEGAVLELTDGILSSFSNNEFTLAVFIDLAKAFDSMDRSILLRKLSYYGFTMETVQ